jgi:DNA-binding beta-propeller fold protein YncE
MRLFIVLSFLAAGASVGQEPGKPVRAVTDPGVVTTRQTISPAGVPAVFSGKVQGVVFGETDADVWVLNNNLLMRFDWKGNRVAERHELSGRPGMQGLTFDRARRQAVVANAQRVQGAPWPVRLLAGGGGSPLREVVGKLGSHQNGAPAVAGDVAVVPLTFDNALAIVDLRSGAAKRSQKTGIAPFAAVLSRDAKTAWVSNWGGRFPKAGELTAPAGDRPNADQVVIDRQGVAATGTVVRVNVETGEVGMPVATGRHPVGMAWDEARGRLYVANGNDDSVSVIDTGNGRLVRTDRIQPFGAAAFGTAPTAVAVSPDGARVYVACGGINAVAVLESASGKLAGLIPTAWYPTSLAISEDGRRLAIGALLGAGSGWRDEPKKRYVHSYRGAVNVVEAPDDAELRRFTIAVSENNRLPLGGLAKTDVAPRTGVKPRAIPERPGEPSLIEHVVYIVKENRTYDQVLGALPQGNGDPSLVMFGRDVTPNTHRLAEQFVLLDNFYATGGNSANGHQWLTQGNETSYTLWPGYEGRSYPYDGTDPIAYSRAGFLWDAALDAGKSVRVYGEFVPGMEEKDPKSRLAMLREWREGADFRGRWKMTSPIPRLDAILNRDFPSYTNVIPDVARAQIFLKDLEQWQKDGRMPNLVIMLLPCDHTMGATPETSTAKAMVADNDLALGQVVEGLTKSKFWSKMAIFVVEDDAQNGVDHVDGHRTVALAVSPYTRRGSVDSTFYSHPSILKTIEQILGLRPLSLFDLIANDMRASFHDRADVTPYTAEAPKQSMDEVNPPLRALQGQALEDARASLKMDFSKPDAAPTERLNRILWRQVRGASKPYPPVRNAVFAPLSLDVDDDDR